jgi:hypothetical protein
MASDSDKLLNEVDIDAVAGLVGKIQQEPAVAADGAGISGRGAFSIATASEDR